MKALLLIDIQNDFLPGGALPVPHGAEIVPVVNRLMARYELVVATQDWHPANHRSFASQHPSKQTGEVIHLHGLEQILWPDHCVQGTSGANFANGLNSAAIQNVFPKGTDRDFDSYSGFFDNARRKATGLESYLRTTGVEEVHLVGLATDYCVKFTALDAVDLGFHTVVLTEGIRGMDLRRGDCQRAFQEMELAGVAVA